MNKFSSWLKNLLNPKDPSPQPTPVVPAPKPVTKPEPVKEEKKFQPPPWYVNAKKYEGKGEKDASFVKWAASYWYLVGLKGYKTIVGSRYAWCGLGMAIALHLSGMSVQKDGAGAKNWAKYGVAIDWRKDGIPRGAIMHLDHDGDCTGDSNHVTQSEGDCSPEDLAKKGASIDGFGANQGNKWKVSTYSVREICAVRWPKDFPLRGRILKSNKCTSGQAGKETTR